MRDSRQLANEFISRAVNKGNTLTPMQLLKLVYIAHGWMLGLYGVPLTRDAIQAWKFGPVIPHLYQAIKHCGSGPVIAAINSDNDALAPVEINILDQVYDKYAHLSGVALSDLTHKDGSPWARVFMPYVTGISIPNDIIQEHYAALAHRGNE